jgi:hypothetical protein
MVELSCKTDSDDMSRGGYRENAGRPSAFPGTTENKPVYMDFTPAGYKVLDGLTERNGLSRNNVIAHLALTYADKLVKRKDFTADGVVFPGKRASNVMTVRLPPAAERKIRAVNRETGKSESDIGEALVTWFGPGEAKFPVLPGADPKRKRRRGRKRGRR